ncbi:hypothetical protein [Paracnuella aquatica]|uniref:hypothetical protein n=1 Tax=Paracnuella aquatica TaxID=2268757 RepID=UPI000DEFC882|nr:hypothetical protein [Paracnuella aquatica]RPD49149.1 hypothetical protein DRJ53_08530 [Paracnuella aquatica]
MKNSAFKYISLFKRQACTVVLLAASVAAFATLGEGKKRDTAQHKTTTLLARTPITNFKNFTLRSGYQYRGSSIINTTAPNKYIVLNQVITYQKGNQTFILPLKKKVLLDKVTFSPTQR